MDCLSTPFRWHPRFAPVMDQAGGRFLLIEDGEVLAFSEPHVMVLAQVAQSGLSLAAYCQAHRLLGIDIQLLGALQSLHGQGLVCAASDALSQHYVTPDLTATPEVLPVDDCSRLLSLSVLTNTDTPERRTNRQLALEFTQSLSRPSGPSGITVVLCDDYLDPRLAQVQLHQAAIGQAWLLAKVLGRQAMLGPVFRPQISPNPCWHCLAERMRRNQAAHSIWEHWGDGANFGLPVWVNTDALRRSSDLLQAFHQAALQMLACESASMWTWHTGAANDALPAAEIHCVQPRPQCSKCGDPSILAKRQLTPVRLDRCIKHANTPGGSRSVFAYETINRLKPLVSGVCGVVVDLARLHDEHAEHLPVYQSHFYRTVNAGAALPTQSFVQTCLGKGMSDMQSQASALCEAVERYAAFYQGDEAQTLATAAELDAPFILPDALSPISAMQRAQSAQQATAIDHHYLLPLERHNRAAQALWAPAWSLTHHARRYLPLGACYANAPAMAQTMARWNSNGCAAGNTLEEAVLQGLLELVERDAAAIWWYNAIARPQVSLDILPPKQRLTLTKTLGNDWDYWLLDITHDLTIPVIVAIGKHRTTGRLGIGFGCSLAYSQAAERAVTELVQLVTVNKCMDPLATKGLLRLGFLYPQQKAQAKLKDMQSHADITQDIAQCVRVLAQAGQEVIVLDYTRPDIPLHTVKVFVPGLNHVWPEFGNLRLFQVPVTLGWLAQHTPEHLLNPWPLYV